MPHTTGRYQARRFRKAQCPIVERLTNSLMMHERNNDKKLVVVRIFKHAMEIIHLLTDANPIQIIIDAVINRSRFLQLTQVLCNIQIFTKVMPSLFDPNFEDLFINTSYAYQVKSLKLEILSSIAIDESILVIFQELQELQHRKENSTCLVALGRDDGEVFTINATSAELKWKSSGHHHSRIAALSFANKGRKRVLTLDGTTCEMNSETDDKIVDGSNTKIRVLTLDDGEELLKFSTDVNAALLTARDGARDPSAIPSICRVSAALQYPAGLEGSDAGLASVLESMEFCLKLRGSEACVLEDLAKAINLVHKRRDLVESAHALLNHAYHILQEYERYEGGTGICDSGRIGICDSIPMPNKRSLILSEGGTKISDSNGIGICDYVGIRIYDSIPLLNQRNLIISEGGTRISDYDRIGISDSDGTKTLQNINENQNCKRTF
ncbi:unnamed protein product [Lactuca virosa]|uniref:Small ribosomal subunit protein uS7 domain-containing protein n=1 Tax=Lactuca virosa TaxID=75947 RepID=A0AAU9PVR1_9ASTR|nr:unnamed protein product [Lactuca virosa]